MSYVTIEKQRYYFRLNEGAQKNDDAMVFIHGSGGDGSVWEYQLSEPGRQHPVIIPDLPGHGNSEGSLLSTAKEYAQWLDRAVDSLKLSSFILVGHSMGGAIAQEYARCYPEKVTGLILAGTGIHFQIQEEYRRILYTSFETAVRTSCDHAYTFPASQELYKKGYEMLMRNGKKTLTSDLEVCEHFDSSNWIKSIRQKTLVVCGKDDRITPCTLSEELSSAMPYSELSIISEAGHMAMMEAPLRFNSALKNFIKKGVSP